MANKKSRNRRAEQRRAAAKGKTQSSGKRTKRQLTEKRWWGPVWLENLVYAAIIVIAGVFIYQRTIDYDLVYCDDNIFVIDYLEYNKNPDNIINSFKKSIGASYYRPVLASSFIIDYQIGEQNPSTYRATNVILHLIGSVLVYFVLVKLRYPRIGALIFGLIFVAHPVLTPAASWISGRNDSLITLFVASSFLALLGFYRSETSNKYIFYALHMLLFAIALFTKETAAFLPFVILAYIVFFKKDKLITSKSISLVAGWGLIGLIWLLIRDQALAHLGESPDTIGLTALWKNLPSVPAMMGKVFLPWKMHALANFEQFSILTGLAAIGAIIAFIFLKKDVDRKKVLFGFLWYLILILPTLLIRIVYVDDFFDYAEHRMYLLMIGIFIIILEILKAYKVDFKNPLVLAVSFIIIAALGYRSFVYQPVFENRKTY